MTLLVFALTLTDALNTRSYTSKENLVLLVKMTINIGNDFLDTINL